MEGGTEDDPTISFRIRNYSAVEEGTGETSNSNGVETKAIPIANAVSLDAANSFKKVGPDDFERLRVIGQGGYGKVFLVRQRDTRTIYAMKVLRKATLIIHTKTVEHTKNERTILSKLEHPFIVKLHYAFQSPEKLYLILQYAPGGELFSHLAQQRMFDEDTASFYIGELLLAIEHLHGLGIIYRDLKPENVLLDAQGHVLLTDFGLSKVALETRTVCGTIEFTAPEVLEVSVDYGCAVDYWSLGVMLFDMLTGAPPFTGQNRKKVMESILKKKLTFPPYLTSFAKDLLTKLLRKNPIQRLGSTTGADEVKKHGFFRKINWRHLSAREIDPPITPNVSHSLDTGNFDVCFTGMALESPTVPGGRGAGWAGGVVADAAIGNAVPSLVPSVADKTVDGGSGLNSGASTPVPGNKKKKHRKKAEQAAAAAAAAAAGGPGSSVNSPNSSTAKMAAIETDVDNSSEVGDVATPLSNTGGGSSSSGQDHHFHGFSFVAENGFAAMHSRKANDTEDSVFLDFDESCV
ncbi:Ribosomal protein S6 kinase beta-1 [Chytriomyces hyalinus]|nr:Ribosomal protein S6 kinase beta-1 [Chytriomyces hyalinus]